MTAFPSTNKFTSYTAKKQNGEIKPIISKPTEKPMIDIRYIRRKEGGRGRRTDERISTTPNTTLGLPNQRETNPVMSI